MGVLRFKPSSGLKSADKVRTRVVSSEGFDSMTVMWNCETLEFLLRLILVEFVTENGASSLHPV